MRKFLFTVLLATSFTALFAQKLDDVAEKVSKKKYDEAKEKIDKELADPKGQANADAWFYKAKIYYNLSKTKPDDATLLPAALDAMKKYLQMEEKQPENKRMLRSTFEANETFFNIYSDYFKTAVKKFQDQDYSGALENFKFTLDAFDHLSKYKLTSVPMDTTATIYAGFSAQNAKKFDDAALYYDKLIQAKVYDTSYIDAYKFMINYYLETKKDTASALRYLEISETAFPKYEDLWIDYEMVTMGNERTKKIARYEQLKSKYPGNYVVAVNHAVELYNNTFFGEDKGSDYPAQQEATKAALERALSLEPNSAHATFIMSQFYVNQIYDLEDSLRLVRGNTPADQAKKKAINAKLDEKYEGLYTHSQKAYDNFSKETTLKAQDKANYRKVINQLIDYHTRKKQTDKVAALEEKLKQLK
ncbi:MAG: hypothetical protein ACXWCZ_01175 [Flavisolibacter sp.]